ncbi:hypothetical protein [Sphingobacterium gobiense]|uniref:Uncharacterized protein n=1 Tax=Sphingobacterium gobiense TaxID=1382456 RepID=A0A2S9JS87_9SPHI|nr:hypothetical protein [Sphingobacterium gobiense]PRD56113.1 hypothetical protein C5749_02210 [Sphingobacterium gobiense]
MQRILYLFIAFYSAVGLQSCEKGEKLNPYEELVLLQFNGLPNGTTVLRNGASVPASAYQSYKVPFGRATYRFEDAEGNILLEQELNVDNDSKPITVFDSGNGLLLVTPIDDVEVNPTKLKLDIANVSDITDKDNVTLAVYRLNLNLEAVTEPTIIRNVTSNFTDEFTEVDFGDLSVFENGESGVIYVLDDNMEPYRKEGLPVAFIFSPTVRYSPEGSAELDKVYKVILKEEEYDIPLEGPFGVYPEGFYMCTAIVLLSK